MTTLATGSNTTVTLTDGAQVAIATNGGMGSIVATLTTGEIYRWVIGPLQERRVIGPFPEGASVLIANQTCGSFDYDPTPNAIGAFAPAFVAPAAASTRNITNADNLATLTAASAVTLTVPAGLTPGLSLTVIGAGVVTWAGSGATVTDQRNTGSSNPVCTLICIGTDTYVVRGEKA